MENATELKHWVVIKVWDKLGDNVLELMRWDDLPWNTRVKFNWYFTYRAALLQVKYPKAIIDHRWGNNGNERTPEQDLQNKIRSKKSKITEYKNKLQLAREQWDSLYPIEEDLIYKKAVTKIDKLENELKCMIK